MPIWAFQTNKNLEEELDNIGIPWGCYEIKDILLFTQNYFDKCKLPVKIALNNKKNLMDLKLRKNVDDKGVYAIAFNVYMDRNSWVYIAK